MAETREVHVQEVKAFKTSSGNTRFVLVDDAANEYTTFREGIARKAVEAEGRRARIKFHEQERKGFTNVYLDAVELLEEAKAEAEPAPETGREVEEAAWAAAVNAAAALIQNAVVNAASCGMPSGSIVSAVKIAAPTCPPMTPPIVRMTVFIPVATPVSVGRTAVTMMFAIAAKVIGMPRPKTSIAATTCHGSSCHSASIMRPIVASVIPMLSGHFDPQRRPITPARGPIRKPARAAGTR